MYGWAVGVPCVATSEKQPPLRPEAFARCTALRNGATSADDQREVESRIARSGAPFRRLTVSASGRLQATELHPRYGPKLRFLAPLTSHQSVNFCQLPSRCAASPRSSEVCETVTLAPRSARPGSSSAASRSSQRRRSNAGGDRSIDGRHQLGAVRIRGNQAWDGGLQLVPADPGN